jgi:hypothetical protein
MTGYRRFHQKTAETKCVTGFISPQLSMFLCQDSDRQNSTIWYCGRTLPANVSHFVITEAQAPKPKVPARLKEYQLIGNC